MSFSEFWEIAEVRNRKELKELRKHRSLMQMFTKDNLKYKMPLPGDFEEYEGIKPMTQEQLKERVRKLGIAKLLNIDG